jgi:ribonuclease R
MNHKILEAISKRGYSPLMPQVLAISMGVSFDDEFKSALADLQKNGQIALTQRGKIVDPKEMGLVFATISNTMRSGGFAKPLDGADIFIPTRDLLGALPSDKVFVKLTGRGRRLAEGVVSSISERNFTKFTGIFYPDRKGGKIIPDGNAFKGEVQVSKHHTGSARSGEKVYAEITKYAVLGRDIIKAKVINSFGYANTAKASAGAILESNGIRLEFPDEVKNEAIALSQRGIIPEDLNGRTDLRDEIIFTIDGADAKDLDDAISIVRDGDGYLLGVHIADVSNYVQSGKPLDNEAFMRGTSVYFANSVVPMLPHELSNGICSLNPNEDRLTFSAFMKLDKSGKKTSATFAKSVIRSRVKGVYSEINSILDQTADEEIQKKYADCLGNIAIMRELFVKLNKLRTLRGALELDTAESKFVIDENGVAIDVKRRTRGEAEQIIEEFMLAANESVASYVLKLDAPLVYRTHDKPDSTKLSNFADAVTAMGINAQGVKDNPDQHLLSSILNKKRGTPLERVLSTLLLRSLPKARYTPECTGHFGLSLDHYCHFTSPIRRYPDLAVHRILSEIIAGVSPEKLKAKYASFTQAASKMSSDTEVKAMQSERSIADCYKAEYMENHIGESFDGIISSATQFGIYVELENTVEGLVRVTDLLSDEYKFDEKSLSLKGVHAGKNYSVGDTVRVRVLKANISEGQIDFALEDKEKE